MKVFLGGTCAGRKWRDELIPLLKCDYYNPIVKNWCEDDRLREVEERKTSDYVLYVITENMKGVYSIAEVVDDSNKRPEKTLFCNLYMGDRKAQELTDYRKQVAHSLAATENLVESNGTMVFHSLEAVADFLNAQVEDAIS